MFESMGAESFTQRAQIELRATGERVHQRATDTGNNLTAQETQISRLVAKGESNPQIAAQLFISPGCAAAGTRWCRFGAGTNCLSR
jgi:DNA-binding NarL/FixJ family response regulator